MVKQTFGPVPVQEGQILRVQIESIGSKGDGIAKIQGYVIMVPHSAIGEKYLIKITAVRGPVSFGEIIETLYE